MYYIPNIVLVGYGRNQLYQIQCLRCGVCYFNMNDIRTLDDLFCDDCKVSDGLLEESNVSEVNYLGNVIGWIQKSEQSKNRSRYNYKKVYKRDGYTCQYCDYSPFTSEEFRPLHVDHVRPFISGGSNRMDNLVVACANCNIRLKDKWFNTFQEKKAYLLSLPAKI